MGNEQKEMFSMFMRLNEQHTANIARLMEAMQQQRSKAMTPEEFHEIQERFEDEFVDSLRTLKLPKAIEPKIGRHYCLLGPTSVGKTSLWNAIFGLNLPIGLGACTKDVK